VKSVVIFNLRKKLQQDLTRFNDLPAEGLQAGIRNERDSVQSIND
jgi:hypothetical protein